MTKKLARYEITAQDKTARAFSSVERRLKDTKEVVRSFTGALAAAVGVGGFGAMIRAAINAGSEISNLSTRLGASTEFLSEMRHATEQTGVQFNQFTTGIQRMTRRIAEAAKDTGEAKNAIKELGLDAKELGKLGIEEQFLTIANAIAGVGNQSDKVRLAMKLFDSEGVSLLQTMEGGAGAIEAFREAARKSGQSLSSDQADKLQEAQKAALALKGTFRGIANSISLEFAPAIAEGAEALSSVLLPVLKIVGGFLKSLGKLIGGLSASFIAFFSGEFVQSIQIAKQALGDLFNAGFSGGGAPVSIKKSTGGAGPSAPGGLSAGARGSRLINPSDPSANPVARQALSIERESGAGKELERQTEILHLINDGLRTMGPTRNQGRLVPLG